MSRRHDRSEHTTADTAPAPAPVSRRGVLLRGGLATAAGVGALSVLSQQQAEAATGGVIGMYSPFDYGALGDGSNDDGPAIQAALDAARDDGGQIVLIPGGYTYKFGQTLHVYSGTTVVAYGAHLYWDTSVTGTSLMNDEGNGRSGLNGYDVNRDITICGGTWDGKGVATQGFTINHGNNYVIRDVTIRNITSFHAIDIQGMRHVRVENCRFEGYAQGSSTFPRGPVQIDHGGETGERNPCVDITVQNCYAGPSDDLGSWGRLVDCHTAALTGPHVQIHVVDNVAEDVTDSAIHAYSWAESVIEGNVITGPGNHGIYAGLEDGVSGSRLIIRDNIIKNAGAGGIRIDPATEGGAVSSGTWSYVEIDGNQIYSPATNGIFLAACLVGSVSNNEIIKVQSSGNHCIQLGETSASTHKWAQSVTVKDNRMYSDVASAIRLNGAHGCVVTGNKIMGTTYTNAVKCRDVTRTIVSRNDCASNSPGTQPSGLTAATWLDVDTDDTAGLMLSSPQGQAVVFTDYTSAAPPTTCGDNFVDGTASTGPTVTVSGTVGITPTAANTPTKATVTLPAGLFSQAPVIVATAETSLPGTQVTGVGIGSRSATQFEVWLTRTNTTGTAVAWIATGPS